MRLIFADSLTDHLYAQKYDTVDGSQDNTESPRHGDYDAPRFDSGRGSRLGIKVDDLTDVSAGAASTARFGSRDPEDVLQFLYDGSIVLAVTRYGGDLIFHKDAYNDNGEELYRTSDVPSSGDWLQYSMVVHVDGSNSRVQCWIGNDLVKIADVDLSAPHIDEVGLGLHDDVAHMDFWIANGAPYGDVRCVLIRPGNVGEDDEWESSDSDKENWEQVYSLDTDEFVYTDTDSARDSHVHDGVTDDDSRPHVLAVTSTLRATQTDDEDRTIATSVRVGGNYYDDDPVTIGSEITIAYSVWTNNPDTDSSWTKDEVDDAEFGYVAGKP